LLGVTVEESQEKCEYPGRLDRRAGAAAVVAADEEPNLGIHERLLLAQRVVKGALRATVMLHCVWPGVPRLLLSQYHPDPIR
jgi:hypothetical protein